MKALAVTDTAFADGKVEGKFETARAMQAEGFDIASIARLTKLTTQQIECYVSMPHIYHL